MGGKNADITYNAAWMGCWAFVEISLGIIVTCALSLPKLIEAKGKKLRNGFSRILRPIASFTSLATLRLTRNDLTTSDAATPNGVSMDQTHSQADLTFNAAGHVLGPNPSHEGWPEVPPIPKTISQMPKGFHHHIPREGDARTSRV